MFRGFLKNFTPPLKFCHTFLGAPPRLKTIDINKECNAENIIQWRTQDFLRRFLEYYENPIYLIKMVFFESRGGVRI